MAKRSTGQFERAPRDYYPTPWEAVRPLLSHLMPNTRFVEPCAGDGALVDHLEAAGHECVWACDIEPQRRGIIACDALETKVTDDFDFFITNPPWDRAILHPLIVHLSDQAPTWLLFDGDWLHTRQAIPYLPRLRRIVSIGRVKWIPDSKHTGKDNAIWGLFDKPRNSAPIFFGRANQLQIAS